MHGSPQLPLGHLDLLAGRYGLGTVHEALRLGGLSAQNWRLVTHAGRFLLKRFAPVGRAQHEAAACLLQALARAGFAAPRLVTASDKKSCVVVGDDAYALYIWRDGEVRHGDALGPDALRAVGRSLAELHLLGPQLALEVPSLRVAPEPDVAAACNALRVWQAKQEEAAVAQDVHEAVARSLEVKLALLVSPATVAAVGASPRRELVHGDFHNENVVFDPAGNVSGIVDFEDAHLGDGLVDVFTFVLLGCCASGFGRDGLARAQTFVCAYTEASGRRLDDRELARGWHKAFSRLASSLFFEQRALRGERDALHYLHRDVARMRTYLNKPDELVVGLWA